MTALPHQPLSWHARALETWNSNKMIVLALAAGLIAGPLISNYMGWQMTRGTAEQRIQASGIEQQAMVCAALAQAAEPNAAGLEWRQRGELAEKYAIMPGRDAAAQGVASACAQRLLNAKS